MEHPRIDDEKIVDRYLAGRLPPEDETRFEEHLFECAACLEQVEWGEELRRDLRQVAAEDAARETVARSVLAVSLLAWLRNRRPAQLAGLAFAWVLLPAFILWQQVELSRLRSASPQTAVLAGPMSELLVVSLGVVRDAGDPVGIRPDPNKEALLLSLELPAVSAARYRATLRDAAGELLWRGDNLEPNLYDTLLIALPSSYLAPGSYRITLEGLSPAGVEPVGAEPAGAEPAGEVAFQVLPEE